MLSIAEWVTIGIGVLAGSTGTEFVRHLLPLLTGRAGRRRDEVSRAWRQADREAAFRRAVEEHAGVLRMLLINRGCVAPEELPAWPEPPASTGQTEARGRERE